MTKVAIRTLDSVTNNDTTATQLINENFQALQTAIENTLSRDGTTPNFMDANLDLNSYKIINAGTPTNNTDVITKEYFDQNIGDAAGYAEAAEQSANRAATSAQVAQGYSNAAAGAADVAQNARDFIESDPGFQTVSEDLLLGEDSEIRKANANKTNIDTVAGSITNVNTVGNDIANVNSVANNLTNIDTVADDLTNIDTVANNITNVNAVGNDIVKVTAVADDLTNIDAVNSNKTNINTVAANAVVVSTVAENIENTNAVGNDIANVNAVAADITKVTAVADDLTNIDAVNANKTNIDTVAGINTNVTTVAGIASDVTAVAGNNTDISAVAADLTKVDTVSANITNVNTVAGISSDVTTVAGISSDVSAVENIASDVTTVAGISSDVTAVAGNNTDISTVADDIVNVNTVATDITNVNTVAADLTNIDAVNANKTNIDTVANNETSINKVANKITEVDTVALISGDVTTVAGNSTNINTVAGVSSNVTTVANNISDVNTVVANITDIQNASANAQLAKDWANKTNGTVDGSEYSSKYYAEQAATILNSKQDQLTSANAGTGISITGSGGNIKINNTQTSAEWGNITGTLSNQTDLNTALNDKVSTQQLTNELNKKQNNLIAGSNITLVAVDSVGQNKLNANVQGAAITARPADNIAVNFNIWYKGAAYNGYMNTSTVSGFSYGVGAVAFTTSDASYGCARFVKLKPNTRYTISCTNAASSHKASVATYIDNGNNTYKASTVISYPTILPFSFTTGSEINYMIDLFGVKDTEITYEGIMLYEGNSATTYVDYSLVQETEISATDTTYSAFTGADGVNAGTSGLVPAPTATDNTKYLKGSGTFAQIAYSEISGTPTIPTVNNATLTIQKNGTTINTFTANASSDVTANIAVPTKTSDLTNDDGFITGITSSDVTTALGYTPYDSSNPNGYTSNVGTVTSVNNVSPVSGNVTIAVGDTLPSQTGNSGKYLTTNGSVTSWASAGTLPSQSGQSGKYLTTDGTDASWATLNWVYDSSTKTLTIT